VVGLTHASLPPSVVGPTVAHRSSLERRCREEPPTPTPYRPDAQATEEDTQEPSPAAGHRDAAPVLCAVTAPGTPCAARQEPWAEGRPSTVPVFSILFFKLKFQKFCLRF
jgi:hypothetical protein